MVVRGIRRPIAELILHWTHSRLIFGLCSKDPRPSPDRLGFSICVEYKVNAYFFSLSSHDSVAHQNPPSITAVMNPLM